MTLANILPVFELTSYLVTIIGFPLAISVFYFERKQDHEDDKLKAFSESSDRYVDFLTLIINYPSFDLFPQAQAKPVDLTAEESNVESSLIAILIDMFEKAYVLYHDGSECIHQKQWSGWQATISSYCGRQNFIREWSVIGEQFDKDFVNHINILMEDQQ